MLSTVTSKGQVTIPKKIRDLIGIHPNDRVDFVQEGDRIVLIPVRSLKDLRGAVTAAPGSDFKAERSTAKKSVGRRVTEEME